MSEAGLMATKSQGASGGPRVAQRKQRPANGTYRWKAFWILTSSNFGELGEKKILVLLTSPLLRKTERGTTVNVWGYTPGLAKNLKRFCE
jgi:hypothetical protein